LTGELKEMREAAPRVDISITNFHIQKFVEAGAQIRTWEEEVMTGGET